MQSVADRFRQGIAAAIVSWAAAAVAAANPPDTKTSEPPASADPTKAAVAAGLRWLAAHQNADGSWRFDQPADSQKAYANPGTCRSRTGATGLALMAFLAAGQTHKDGNFKEVVGKGLEFLLRQGKRGEATLDFRGELEFLPRPAKRSEVTLDLRGEGDGMVCHGIATYALCEAYAMTRDRNLVDPAQQAVNFISQMQDKNSGGWPPRSGQEPTMTVFFWQLTALRRAAMFAYLRIPNTTLERAYKFLNSVQSDNGAKYGETGPDDVTPRSTFAGLLGRDYFGWPRERIVPASRQAIDHGYPRNDVLGNFAAQLLAQSARLRSDGPLEEHWKQARKRLLSAQVTTGPETGSWFDPKDPSAKRGGRLCHTAMNLLTATVIYRYPPWVEPRGSEDKFPL